MSDGEVTLETGSARIEKLWCTPEKAQELLRWNTFGRQRGKRAAHVQRLAKEMEEGRFDSYTQIALAHLKDASYLINGQHTLEAIVQSGVPQLLSVVHRDCRDEREIGRYYCHVDVGLKRTQGDHLKALDMPHEMGLTPTQTRYVASGVLVILAGFHTRGRSPVPPEELAEVMMEYRDAAQMYFQAIADCPQMMITPLTRASTVSVALATCRFAAQQVGHQKAYDFWHQVAFDDGLRVGDPRKTLNRDLIETYVAKRHNDGAFRAVSGDEHVHRVARCWNSWVAGEALQQIKLTFPLQDVHIEGTPFVGKQAAVAGGRKGR